jgi:N-acetylmuramoyl-L-alanine amidase
MAAPRYAHVIVGAREVVLSPRAVVDGDVVYAPVDILKTLGVSYAVGDSKVSIALGEGSTEINLVKRDSISMIRLDEIAKATDLDYMWNDSTSTVKLLSKLVAVEFDDSVLIARLTLPVMVSSARIWEPNGDLGWRISIDLPGTRLATGVKAYSSNGSGVSGVRLGQFTDDTARIVIDLGSKTGYRVLTKGTSKEIKIAIGGKQTDVIRDRDKDIAEPIVPVSITGITIEPNGSAKAKVRVATSGRPVFRSRMSGSMARVVVEIDNASFAMPLEDIPSNSPLVKGIQTNVDGSMVRITCDANRYIAFNTEGDSSGITINLSLPFGAGGNLSDKVIVIDAGHGGDDPGAQAGGYKEKDLNLDIALRVKQALEEVGAKVILTRADDYYVKLPDRPAVADKNKADFFISLHCNACAGGALTGIETYYHPGQFSSQALAYAIQNRIIQHTSMKDRGARLDTKLYASGLAVLRNANVPAILIECGFIDNAKDRSRLIDYDYHTKIAQGIIEGLRDYIEGKTEREAN